MNSHVSLIQFHEDYLSLSPDNFAKLFRPKAPLFNKILELSIDDLHYISYPCPCSDELKERALLHPSYQANNIDVITLFNVIIVTVRDSALKRVLMQTKESTINSMSSDKIFESHRPGMDPVAAAMGLRSNRKVSNINI